MITPFVEQKTVVNGKSYGLSAASYDVRIAHDLVLGPNPIYTLMRIARSNPTMNVEYFVPEWIRSLKTAPPSKALAHTIEDFHMPHNVVGYVCDKSTYARVFVSAFNTLFDPGFIGNATLELVNLNDHEVFIRAEDPICQFTFHWLDRKTDRPYDGKYQHQTKAAHPARFEESDLGHALAGHDLWPNSQDSRTDEKPSGGGDKSVQGGGTEVAQRCDA